MRNGQPRPMMMRQLCGPPHMAGAAKTLEETRNVVADNRPCMLQASTASKPCYSSTRRHCVHTHASQVVID
jgi:phage terminase large subunit-like protein